jgi:hypothetical protein
MDKINVENEEEFLYSQEADTNDEPTSVEYGKGVDYSADADDELAKTEEMESFIATAPIEEIEEFSNPVQDDVQMAFNKFSLNNNDFFKNNPEKVLGEAYETSGRFGKVTKYKGTIDSLDTIIAPLNFIGNQKNDDPLNSSVPFYNASAELMNPASDALVSKALYQTEVDKKRKRAKKTIEVIDEQDPQSLETISFSEMYNAVDKNGRGINADISFDELEAYVWYQTQKGTPLSRNWINLVEPNKYSEDLQQTEPYNVTPEKVLYWIKEGVCYYYRGSVVPAYIYMSGDMYDKKLALDNTDKEKIIEVYGEDIYNQQVANFGLAFTKKLSKKLTINDTESSLVILAISKFAKNFKVKTIELTGGEEGLEKYKTYSRTPFNRLPYKVGEGGTISINWENLFQNKNSRNERYFEDMSLSQAFIYWLYYGKPMIKVSSINAWEVAKYYVLGKSPQATGKNQSDKVKAQRASADAQAEGERLFKIFLNEQLTANDKIRVETEFNAKFNNYLPVDWNKVPIAFTMCKYVKGQRELLDPIKREAVAFMMHTGKGVLSYDVGVGKTPSSIFTLSSFLDAGYCQRPFICVPNQVYRQFITELKTFAPHFKINEAYNLSDDIALNFMSGGQIVAVPKGTITIMTYEGLERIGFGEEVRTEIYDGLYDILSQKDITNSAKAQTQFQAKLETIMGKVEKGTIYNIEDFGWDFGVYDEAHKMKKSFTQVKGDATGNTTEKGTTEREKNPYSIGSGSPSSIAIKGFSLNYYLQKRNKGRNIMLLTATPFTNSPLEIYSMLAMVGYDELEKSGLNSLKTMFDTFVMQKMDYVISAQYGVQLKKVIVGFNNLIALQTLIRKFILYKTGEEANVKRPKKYVLPYTKKVDGETIIELSSDEKVETYLDMTASQFELMELIKGYVAGGVGEEDLFMGDYFQTTNTEDVDDEEDYEEGDANESDEEILQEYLQAKERGASKEELKAIEEDNFVKIIKSKKDGTYIVKRLVDAEAVDVGEDDVEDITEKTAVRILKGLSYGRDLAISPYLMQINIAVKLKSKGKFPKNLQVPVITPTMFVETSPKLLYAMKSIESVRDYHIAEGTPISGQVLYMDRGVKYFPLLRQYLIDVVGYAEHEVQIIQSGLPKTGKKSKEYIKNLFNGEVYNESTKLFEPIDDEQRVKVIIGSSTIKEGINLQKYGTVLYNMNIDWNPTDVQQLEGRIYRQGNTFNSVRVVHPLLVNSADIFIFQKLQEKTARINSIWSMDGRTNVLNTTDFDPSELKYTLISDINVLMTLEIGARQKTLNDNVAVYTQLRDNIASIKYKVNELVPAKYHRIKNHLNAWLKDANYPLFEEDMSKTNFEHWQSLIKKNIATMKLKVDGKGDAIANYSYEAGKVYERDKENRPLKVYSESATFEPQYYFNDVTLPSRDIQKAVETYFAPLGIPFDVVSPTDEATKDIGGSWRMPDNKYVDQLAEKYQSELDGYITQLKEMESSEFQASLYREIKERIEDMRVDTKDLNKVVADFGKLNYLLSDKRVTIQPSQVAVIEPTPSGEVIVPEKSPKEILLENIKLMKDLLSLVDDKADRKVIMSAIKQIKDILPLF